jgi:ParB family chromosome partitioning protein
MVKKQDKKFVDLPLSKLKPHPRNRELYARRSRQQIEELAEDMKKNGQTEEVEVTPDGIIISGHGRCEAAKLLGWKTIRCWVRHDLAEAGFHAVETRLIEANLYRRQMSRLDMVRSYQRLKSLAKSKGRYDASMDIKGDLRDMLAKRFGMSGRNLDRWLQVLTLPLTLQEAVDQNTLKLIEAVKIAVEPKKVQELISDRIAEVISDEGVDIKQRRKAIKVILDSHLPEETEEQQGVGALLKSLVSALKKARAELEHRIHEVKAGFFGSIVEDLRKGRDLIVALIARMERNSRKTTKKLKQVAKSASVDEEE